MTSRPTRILALHNCHCCCLLTFEDWGLGNPRVYLFRHQRRIEPQGVRLLFQVLQRFAPRVDIIQVLYHDVLGLIELFHRLFHLVVALRPVIVVVVVVRHWMWCGR